jgi:hypothetical protein
MLILEIAVGILLGGLLLLFWWIVLPVAVAAVVFVAVFIISPNASVAGAAVLAILSGLMTFVAIVSLFDR